MSDHKIKFLPHDREITVPDGEFLIRGAMEAGVHINASCGGEGVIRNTEQGDHPGESLDQFPDRPLGLEPPGQQDPRDALHR